jgi:hypothetical protein
MLSFSFPAYAPCVWKYPLYPLSVRIFANVLKSDNASIRLFLAFDNFYILVFHDCKFFNIEALRIVVGTNGVDEIAGSNQVTPGYVA